MISSTTWGYMFMYLPLLIACSSVIGATRFEKRELILREIIGGILRITAFMLAIYAILQLVSWCI